MVRRPAEGGAEDEKDESVGDIFLDRPRGGANKNSMIGVLLQVYSNFLPGWPVIPTPPPIPTNEPGLTNEWLLFYERHPVLTILAAFILFPILIPLLVICLPLLLIAGPFILVYRWCIRPPTPPTPERDHVVVAPRVDPPIAAPDPPGGLVDADPKPRVYPPIAAPVPPIVPVPPWLALIKELIEKNTSIIRTHIDEHSAVTHTQITESHKETRVLIAGQHMDTQVFISEEHTHTIEVLQKLLLDVTLKLRLQSDMSEHRIVNAMLNCLAQLDITEELPGPLGLNPAGGPLVSGAKSPGGPHSFHEMIFEDRPRGEAKSGSLIGVLCKIKLLPPPPVVHERPPDEALIIRLIKVHHMHPDTINSHAPAHMHLTCTHHAYTVHMHPHSPHMHLHVLHMHPQSHRMHACGNMHRRIK